MQLRGFNEKKSQPPLGYARRTNEQTAAVMVSGISGEETGGSYYNRLPNEKK